MNSENHNHAAARQFQNLRDDGLEQYLGDHGQVILYPPRYKDGELEQPFNK